MKIERVHLQLDNSFASKLIGISCAEKDYRLCWALNHQLGLDMERKSNEGIPSRIHLADYPFFEYINENNGQVYRLLANRFESKVLLSELKTIDFLFLLQGEDINLQDITTKITNIDFVFHATEIELNKLKERDILYLDE